MYFCPSNTRQSRIQDTQIITEIKGKFPHAGVLLYRMANCLYNYKNLYISTNKISARQAIVLYCVIV